MDENEVWDVVCVMPSVCVYVQERERDRETEKKRDRERERAGVFSRSECR